MNNKQSIEIFATNESSKISIIMVCRSINTQRKRLGVVGELAFRLPITEAPMIAILLMFYS